VEPAAQSAHLQALFPYVRPLVRARFGQWGALLGADAREDAPHLARLGQAPFTAALWAYARALALERTGRRAEAAAEAARLDALAARVPQLTQYTGTPFDGCHHKLATVMRLTVAAALALPDDSAVALESMRQATALYDSMPYMEPEHWYTQPRLCVGALLLRADDAAGAREAFEADLRQHPNSGWALVGLRAAQRLAGDEAAASLTDALVRAALADADVELGGTCCELGMC